MCFIVNEKIKDLTLQIIAGANVATAVTMFLVGLSDRINPTEHPIMANIGLIFPGFIFINFCFLVFLRCSGAGTCLFPCLALLSAILPCVLTGRLTSAATCRLAR